MSGLFPTYAEALACWKAIKRQGMRPIEIYWSGKCWCVEWEEAK